MSNSLYTKWGRHPRRQTSSKLLVITCNTHICVWFWHIHICLMKYFSKRKLIQNSYIKCIWLSIMHTVIAKICKIKGSSNGWNLPRIKIDSYGYNVLSQSPYFCALSQRSHARWCNGPLTRYVKLLVAHVPGMPGTFSPPLRVSDPSMHHGTCVTHVPCCMPGSLSSAFLWSHWRGKRSWHSRCMGNPQFQVSGNSPIEHPRGRVSMKPSWWTLTFESCQSVRYVDIQFVSTKDDFGSERLLIR